MKGPGILWMLQTAAGFSMAGPLFYLGIVSIRLGEYTTAVLYLSLGGFVLYFPTFLVNRFTGRISRIGGPRTWVRRRFSRTQTDETESDGEPHTDADTHADVEPHTADESPPSSTSSIEAGRLERLRRYWDR